MKQSELKERERAIQIEQSLQQLKQTQIQLIQSEKMSSIGQLVAGVAHEINNPINFIAGNITYIDRYIQDLVRILALYQQHYTQPIPEIVSEIDQVDLPYMVEDLPKIVSSIKHGTNRIQEISNSLRNFSRTDTTNKIAFNIHEGIDSTLMILKHRLKANNNRPEIQIIKKYSDLPLVHCYPGQLNQVFLNLLANAIDALDESVQGLSYREIEANPKRIAIHTELSQDHHWNVIRIKDNGIGIETEIKQKIFDHLFTTKPIGKGTGLGLSISHQIIVEKHSGKIACHSKLGEGTEFVIGIPV